MSGLNTLGLSYSREAVNKRAAQEFTLRHDDPIGTGNSSPKFTEERIMLSPQKKNQTNNDAFIKSIVLDVL